MAGLRARGPRGVQGLHEEGVSAEVQHGRELVQGACAKGVAQVSRGLGARIARGGSVQGLHRRELVQELHGEGLGGAVEVLHGDALAQGLHKVLVQGLPRGLVQSLHRDTCARWWRAAHAESHSPVHM